MGTVKPIRSLLITSADPSEGKSTVAMCLAISLASSGSKVLLVEADLRRPRMSDTLQLPPKTGLTHALATGDEVTRHVQPSGMENMDVLISGAVPPNPGELLQTDRFRTILAACEATYDIVIIDSPPVLPVADSLVLSTLVDGALLVVRSGRTTRHALRHALRQLQSVNSPLLGMVLNFRDESSQRYGYGSGYGYGYGYGYGQPYSADQPTESEVSA
jgi:capsular exopolysaccharide synthesis family protein